jgi:SAM-dependent methyltransferase
MFDSRNMINLKYIDICSKYLSFEAPSLNNPVSQACTASQFSEPAYAYWAKAIKEKPRFHRKQWEFCFILQALAREGMMAPQIRGLGFGVGREPLASLFASRGVSILATDLDPGAANDAGWAKTNQHAQNIEILNEREICKEDDFKELVTFEYMDMNKIGVQACDFDFCWSACALEHLGSIEKGLQFIKNSLKCLNPGGIAIHTTELNCTSDHETLDNGSTVLFRRSDFMSLAKELIFEGHQINLNFNTGDSDLDKYLDMPPYSDDKHLKLQLDQWTTTSFGLIIKKGK